MNLNPWAMFFLTAAGILLSIACHGLIAAWYYGRLTEKVAAIDMWRVDAIKQLLDLTQRVTKVEAWIEGQR